MSNISLNITVEETNLVLQALGNLPFAKVHELITKIHQQGNTQVQPEAASVDEVTEQTADNVTELEPEQAHPLKTGTDAQ